MSQGVRVIGPDRAQLGWEMVDLDSQLPDDHRARLVWAFVEGLDLSEFYDRIKARDTVAAPARNVQSLPHRGNLPGQNTQAGVATSNGFIVGIDPTDRRKDSGLAPGLVETIAERCGRVPQRLLADTTAMTQGDDPER